MRLLTGILLSMLVVMQPAGPAVASGLSIHSCDDAERSRSGLPDESSEERFEEAEEECGSEAGYGDFLPPHAGRQVLLESSGDRPSARASRVGPSLGLAAHGIRGPPLP